MGIAHVMTHAADRLPDSPYALWVRDELADHLNLPEGSRVEIVGGEIVVSPAPVVRRYSVTRAIQNAVDRVGFQDPGFPWLCIPAIAFREGYIPDLVLIDSGVFEAADQADARFLTPEQVEMVIEVTSPSTARNDRRPRKGGAATKWSGFARAGIPWYLLVDRDPRDPGITLYSEPYPAKGTYKVFGTWQFGETVRLPFPFAEVEIPTDKWKPWSK